MKQKQFYPKAGRLIYSLFAVTALFIGATQPAKAGFYTASMTESSIATTGFVYGINCDMIECPQFGGRLQAIAWGAAAPYGGIGSGNVEIVVRYDMTGNTATLSLPSGTSNPDIVWADDMNSLGTDYKIAVVYNVNEDEVRFRVYSVTNITSTITINPTPLVDWPFVVGTGSPGQQMRVAPHIDMYKDYAYTSSNWGQPALHEYAIVFMNIDVLAPPSTQNTIELVQDDVSNTMPASTTTIYSASGGVYYEYPDVACAVDGSGNKVATVATIKQPGIIVQDYDATNTPISLPVVNSTYAPYATTNPGYPRIECEGYFSGTNPKWNVAFSAYNPSISSNSYEIHTMNNFGSSTNYDVITSYNSSIFHNYMPLTIYNPNIGTGQFTTGWVIDDPLNGGFGWPFLCQGQDIATALPTSPHDYFIGRNTIIGNYPVYSGSTLTTYPFGVYPVGLPSLLAMSSTSNSENDIFSAWFDGTNIQWKYTNAMAFKPTSVTTIGENKFAIFPNPATTEINVGFEKAISASDKFSFVMTDITGKEVYRTDKANPGSNKVKIQLPDLAKGVYISTTVVNSNKHFEKITIE